MILDGMPDQTGNRTTLLLEAGNKTIVAQCVDVENFMVMLVGGRTYRGVVKSPMNQDVKAITSLRVK